MSASMHTSAPLPPPSPSPRNNSNRPYTSQPLPYSGRPHSHSVPSSPIPAASHPNHAPPALPNRAAAGSPTPRPQMVERWCKSPLRLYYSTECAALAREVERLAEGKVELCEVEWKRFADGWPNLQIQLSNEMKCTTQPLTPLTHSLHTLTRAQCCCVSVAHLSLFLLISAFSQGFHTLSRTDTQTTSQSPHTRMQLCAAPTPFAHCPPLIDCVQVPCRLPRLFSFPRSVLRAVRRRLLPPQAAAQIIQTAHPLFQCRHNGTRHSTR